MNPLVLVIFLLDLDIFEFDIELSWTTVESLFLSVIRLESVFPKSTTPLYMSGVESSPSLPLLKPFVNWLLELNCIVI